MAKVYNPLYAKNIIIDYKIHSFGFKSTNRQIGIWLIKYVRCVFNNYNSGSYCDVNANSTVWF